MNNIMIKTKDRSRARIKLRNSENPDSLNMKSNNNVKKHSLIEKLINKCRAVVDICFLCKADSQGELMGPFYTSDYINFDHFEEDTNSNDANKQESVSESIKIVNEDDYYHYYFHVNCFIKLNDFLVYDNQEIQLKKTIKEVLIKKKTCWRCE